MTRTRFENALPAALTVGFALTLPISATAQVGPGLSSGSGAGTGTGYSSGIQRNPSGSVSGLGAGTIGGGLFTNSGGIGPYPGAMPYAPRSSFSVPAGPGVSTSFPDDTSLFPFLPPGGGGVAGVADLVQVPPRELDEILRIADPGERSLALQRFANVAIFSGQLPLAHRAIGEASKSVFALTDPVIRDLRLMAIITTLNNLSEAHLREGKVDLGALVGGMDEPAPTPTPAPPGTPAAALPRTPPSSSAPAPVDRGKLVARAELEWRRAAYLAARISNPTYRSEMLFRVVDSESYGSQTIINEFARDVDSLHGTAPGAGTPPAKRDSTETLADDLLVKAAQVAVQIERPVWRDRSLVAIAYAAAQSSQFARGLEVARMIPQPEVRSDALVKIAESQARPSRDGRHPNGMDPGGATSTYREAAQAVASIPLDDPRAVLTGVLIDNLISVGRFEDARATVSLYPDTPRRLIALGAIAESQGFRGAGDSAVAWINRDIPAQYRASLLRRVRYGVLAAVEQNRSRDLSNRDRER